MTSDSKSSHSSASTNWNLYRWPKLGRPDDDWQSAAAPAVNRSDIPEETQIPKEEQRDLSTMPPTIHGTKKRRGSPRVGFASSPYAP